MCVCWYSNKYIKNKNERYEHKNKIYRKINETQPNRIIPYILFKLSFSLYCF